MTIYVLHPESDRVFEVEGAFIVQDSEITEEEEAVLNDGLIPQSLLDKSTHLSAVVDHYMGIRK